MIWQVASHFTDPQFFPGRWQTLQGAIVLSEDGSLFHFMGISKCKPGKTKRINQGDG
jgi:NitT/TauT family transport system permease protein